MLFNSFEFIAFFALFLLIYFNVADRARPWVLLAASYVFYMSWEPVFVLLLLFTTVVDFATALVMGNSDRRAIRLTAMWTALGLNLGILVVLKYGNFLTTNLTDLTQSLGGSTDWRIVQFALPVGISFYTFQSIGYTLDVYHRRTPAERSFLTYAQYVAFFPQLVAGPIERASHMIPQFMKRHQFRAENIAPGMWLIGWGLFKKMCVADQIAPFVNTIYANPDKYHGSYAMLATALFAIQIYCDFSGYSSIARGVARLFDFDLMVNFRQPYFARSLSDFWSKWHISLSTWFRDYLYVPLGGNRAGRAVMLRNVLIVFVVSGIWHGASWCFAVWGLVHGLGLVIERLLRWQFEDAVKAAHPAIQLAISWAGRLATLGLVLAAWVFFRARTLDDAWLILGSFGQFTPIDYAVFKMSGFASFEILLSCLFIPSMFGVEAWVARSRHQHPGEVLGAPLSILLGVLLMFTILLFGVFGQHEFIYFQF
ncbi:MBOAT family O-acyltransferase [Aquabacterium sp.]|uniref:MBOAT family O-acyltransferase n=1 Tax=Aquabacterium sp. TaxID=1872578 RepID=UPI002487D621|nr:MBOAT family O-acyltransferase [Aquabacterium sp.]MDI1347749.1 MBOAT family protein [Aquabacterium sp.]